MTTKHKNQNQHANQNKPSYSDVLQAALLLSNKSTPQEMRAVLQLIALGCFESIEFEQLLAKVTSQTSLPKKEIRRTINQYQHQFGLEKGDPAIDVAKAVLSEYFADGVHLLRNPDGFFYKFVGTHWVRTNEAAIRNLVQRKAKEYAADRVPKLVNESFASLRDMLGSDEDVLNQGISNVPVVNVQNGELWIMQDGSVDLRDHNPLSGLTHCLPFTYDPNATCPRFSQAMAEIFQESTDSSHMIRHVREFFGYVIQPSRNISSFWLWIGHGANGKSLLLKILQELLGPDATINDNTAKFMKDRFNTAYLEGKLLFVDDDLSENTVLDDGLLKSVSEAKKMSARRAYGSQKRDFVCRALAVMAGNCYPLTKDVSNGMLRRAQVLPFAHIFSEDDQDIHLFDYIQGKEMPGILNWALSGLKGLQQRGKFDPPVDCIDARDEFFRHANPFMAFLTERCEKDPKARTHLSELRYALFSYASEQGVKKPAGADNTLKRKLEGLGYKVSYVNGFAKVFGLRLKNPLLNLD